MSSIALDRDDAPAADLPRAGAASPPATNWRMVVVLTMIFSLSSIDRGIIPLLVEPIRADLGLSDVQMSLLLGLSFVLLFSLCALPAGYLADIMSRSEEHTSELQSLMRISSAVFCRKQNTN